MGLFLFAEFMLFMGLVSAFLIVKSNAVGQVWPPPGQPRLPVEQTAFNSLILMVSGVLLYLGHRAYASDQKAFKKYLLGSIVLGVVFVGLQGAEWVDLISVGLTLASGAHGAFFYLLVGCHALHAIFAIGFLGFVYLQATRNQLKAQTLWAAEFFWYFVVGMWPLLYWLVYL
jgi:cytochrome c oxidase subunit 3